MSKRTRLTRAKFHAINRDLKMHNKVKDVAAVQGVSEETVRTVKRAKTWPRFEAMKKLKNEQRRPTVVSQPVKAVAKQQSLGVEEALDQITQKPSSQDEIKVVTLQEWETLNRKLGLLYRMVEPNKGFLSKLWSRK
jgi:hypothetical protein